MRKQTSEPDVEMAWMWEISDWGCKITMINMLRAFMEKVDNIREQIGNVSREMDILMKE